MGQELVDIEGDTKVVGTLNIIKSEGDSSILIGPNTGLNDDGSNINVFVGANAGRMNTTGRWNTFIGYNSGSANMTGGDNTFVGNGAGLSNVTGPSNSFFGKNAGRDNLGRDNTMLGKGTGVVNVNGSSNTFIGTDAGNQNVGSSNTFIGRNAGRNNVGSLNVFIGNAAGQNHISESNKLIIDNTNSITSPLIFGDFNNNQLAIGTGTFATGHALSVNGKVACEEVRVQLQAEWPDYVFKDSYELRTLDEVQSFISKNGYLPGVPSANKIATNGLQLGEMNRVLMEKIEELMLYTLQQQKEMDALKLKASEQQREIENLKKAIK